MLRTAPLAVFDLDGTLVDTAPDLVDACNVVLAAAGYGAVQADAVRPTIGLGGRAILAQALIQTGRDPNNVDVDALLAAFLAEYQSRIARLSRPFPEMIDAIHALSKAGVALAVCTNKREGMARTLLDALGLLQHFVALTGGDTYAAKKPDPLPLRQTVAAAGGTLTRTVFVGDSLVDFETATAAAVPLVGVTYGYSEVPMEKLGPDRLCARGDDVAAAVLSCLTRGRAEQPAAS